MVCGCTGDIPEVVNTTAKGARVEPEGSTLNHLRYTYSLYTSRIHGLTYTYTGIHKNQQ